MERMRVVLGGKVCSLVRRLAASKQLVMGWFGGAPFCCPSVRMASVLNKRCRTATWACWL